MPRTVPQPFGSQSLKDALELGHWHGRRTSCSGKYLQQGVSCAVGLSILLIADAKQASQ